MPAGRPRKPDEVKVLEGTWRKDRDGDPATIPLATGEPSPPRHLKGEGLAFWNEVVPGLVQSGVAKAQDAAELATMCEWWARYRRFSRQLDRMKGTDKRLYQATLTVAITWDKFNIVASRFGLTPSDRSKLRLGSEVSAKKGVASRKRG